MLWIYFNRKISHTAFHSCNCETSQVSHHPGISNPVQSVCKYIRLSDSGLSGKLALYSVSSERVALSKAGSWSMLWCHGGLVWGSWLMVSVCGKHKYLPSVCNYCQIGVHPGEEMLNESESQSGCACCLTCGSLWIEEDVKLEPAAGWQTPARAAWLSGAIVLGSWGTWAWGDLETLKELCMYRPGFSRPACWQWSQTLIVIWVVSVLKTAQHLPPAEPYSLVELLMIS